ncbi:MAG: GtrA family protein [Clostridia bacterium]|nr:GtrA family protein [Clostridia bacterium]
MKEFFEIIFSFDFKRIFCQPTKNSLLQFFRYAFVGGWATVADWGILYILTELANVHYLISGVASFVTGLAVNFILSKKFVFSAEENTHSSSTEFIVYAIIGIIGLIMTEAIMYILTDKLGIYFMIPKIVATAVVFAWNFLARKIVLYR